MNAIEIIHAFAIGIDENKNPEEFKYLYKLLLTWTTLEDPFPY